MTSPRGPVPHLPPVDPAYLRRGPGRAKTLTLGALGLGAVGACVWGLVVAAGAFRHDPLELIDSDPMYEALAAPCAAIQEAAARVDPAAPAVERAARLAGVVTTIDDLAASVAALPEDVVEDDIPTRGWVADWETFGSRLTDYSTALASGTETELDTPLTQDGYTVVTRMDLAAPEGCEMPAVLVALDPTPPPAPSMEPSEE